MARCTIDGVEYSFFQSVVKSVAGQKEAEDVFEARIVGLSSYQKSDTISFILYHHHSASFVSSDGYYKCLHKFACLNYYFFLD